MSYDYFYGQSGELFSYFRIPKALFQDSRFRQLSTDARTLYGILLDRMSLSAKNNWLDEQGRVYIIYTVREVQESLCCAEHKAVKLFRELEQANLIERKRRGLAVSNFYRDVLGYDAFGDDNKAVAIVANDHRGGKDSNNASAGYGRSKIFTRISVGATCSPTIDTLGHEVTHAVEQSTIRCPASSLSCTWSCRTNLAMQSHTLQQFLPFWI